MRSWLSFAVYLFLLQHCCAGSASATDVAIRLDASISGQVLTVQAANTGGQTAGGIALEVELAGQVYRPAVSKLLAPGKHLTAQLALPEQAVGGSYPVVVQLTYQNGPPELPLSVRTVLLLHQGEEKLLPMKCALPRLALGTAALAVETAQPPASQRLVLPAQIELVSEAAQGRKTTYTLRNKREDLTSQADYFLVTEIRSDRAHSTAICRSMLTTVPASSGAGGSAFGYGAAAALAFAAIVLSVLMGRLSATSTGAEVVNARWLFSIFTVALLLCVMHRFGTFFSGANYDYFRAYAEQPLFYYMVLLNYPVLKYLVKPDPAADKYWHLLSSLLARLPYIGRKFSAADPERSFDAQKALLALRTIAVKAFYVPLLTSWFANDVIHQISLTREFSLTFAQVTAYLIALCILIDVAVFMLGYLTELPQLKNEIRSVDATLAGWLVCLVCYPPFTEWSIARFDIPLNESWAPVHGMLGHAATSVIVLLWCIYTWATVALGFRASNLTNRGIVSHGPYRYVRHPAYVSKLAVWIISSFALGTMNFYLIVTLVAVYSLRAFTEERHLSRDAAYIEYTKRVRWRVLPGIF